MSKASKVIAGTSGVVRLGESLAISLPAEFCHLHHIKEGDDLPFAADLRGGGIMKVIPMPEDEEVKVSDGV